MRYKVVEGIEISDGRDTYEIYPCPHDKIYDYVYKEYRRLEEPSMRDCYLIMEGKSIQEVFYDEEEAEVEAEYMNESV